eukprot:31326-Pyramimonas_sp.AAC.1
MTSAGGRIASRTTTRARDVRIAAPRGARRGRRAQAMRAPKVCRRSMAVAWGAGNETIYEGAGENLWEGTAAL